MVGCKPIPLSNWKISNGLRQSASEPTSCTTALQPTFATNSITPEGNSPASFSYVTSLVIKCKSKQYLLIHVHVTTAMMVTMTIV